MNIIPIEPVLRGNLIRLAEVYCAATERSLTTCGRYAHSEPTFFQDLIKRQKAWIKQGKPDRVDGDRTGSFTLRVYDKVLAWFVVNWPTDTDFPKLDDPKHSPKRTNHGTTESDGTQEAPQAARPEQGKDRAGSASETLARLRSR